MAPAYSGRRRRDETVDVGGRPLYGARMDRRSSRRVARAARRLAGVLGLAGAVLLPPPAPARNDPIAVVDDHVYREGVFLVVDALVANATGGRIDGVEATVVLVDFFDALVRAEHTVVRPVTLGPEQVGSLRIVTPYSDRVRKLRYRFTWRRDGQQFQSLVPRDIWTLGSATRR
jgi:hypothetical protein